MKDRSGPGLCAKSHTRTTPENSAKHPSVYKYFAKISIFYLKFPLPEIYNYKITLNFIIYLFLTIFAINREHILHSP